MKEGRNIRTLTSKDVKNAIKSGTSIDSLLEKYNCDLDAFKKRLEILFKKDWEKEFKKLVKSEEKVHGRTKATKERLEKGEQMLIEQQKSMVTDEVINKEEVETNISILDLLKTKESAIMADLGEFRYYVDYLIHESEFRKDLLFKANQKLIQLVKEIQETIDRREDLAITIEEINGQIDQINAVRRQKQIELSATQEEMADLEAVTIYVYQDGSIVGENKAGEEVELNDSGFEKLRSSLVYREECEEVSVKDTWTLARALRIVKNLKFKYTAIFDNPTLETAFYALFSN